VSFVKGTQLEASAVRPPASAHSNRPNGAQRTPKYRHTLPQAHASTPTYRHTYGKRGTQFGPTVRPPHTHL